MMYKVFLQDEALRCYLLSEQYCLVVLFIVLYKVVLAFELADDILKCYYIQMKATVQYFPMVLLLCRF